MRKLIVQQYISLDNFIAKQDGDLGFVNPYVEHEVADYMAEAHAFLDDVDTMLLGRTTYEMFVNSWPNASEEDEFAQRINSMHKFVASKNHLTDAPWGADNKWESAKVTSDPVETVRELKKGDGKDIVLWGSSQVQKVLVDADEVDEYYFRLCPTTLKTGMPNYVHLEKFKLTQATSYTNNIAVLRYSLK